MNTITRVLAVDTATPHLVLGLLEYHDDTETLALEHVEVAGRAHAERVIAAMHDLFRRAGGPARADLVVAGTGPGSYTGVRVAASVALGVARAWHARVTGVPTLEAVAAARDGVIAASIDARKGNAYGAVYRVHHGLIAETVLPPAKRDADEFAALIPRGAAWLRDEPPSGTALARLGRARGAGKLDLQYL